MAGKKITLRLTEEEFEFFSHRRGLGPLRSNIEHAVDRLTLFEAEGILEWRDKTKQIHKRLGNELTALGKWEDS